MALPFSPPCAIAGNDGCVRVIEMTVRALRPASVVPPRITQWPKTEAQSILIVVFSMTAIMSGTARNALNT
jgi:hypothetical protein